MSEIKVTTGAVKYTFKDEFDDEIGVLKFNPGDMNILRRYEDVQKWFGKLEIKNDMTQDDFFELTDNMKKQLDYLLNTDTAEVFKVCNPLTPTGEGKVFFLNVLEVIENLIRKSMETKMDKYNAAIKDIVE